MKKEITEALKAKFPGVSESILGRIADKLAKSAATQEQLTTAVEGVTIQHILESYGDSRATEAQQTAVLNYEKKYGLRGGRKVVGEAPKSEPGQETPPGGEGDRANPSVTDEAAMPGARRHLVVVKLKYEYTV